MCSSLKNTHAGPDGVHDMNINMQCFAFVAEEAFFSSAGNNEE